jgi:prophage regulatory protein
MTIIFLRRPEVERRTGLKRSTLYAKIKNGDFPSPVKLGARAVAWPESEINTWLSERLEARACEEKLGNETQK